MTTITTILTSFRQEITSDIDQIKTFRDQNNAVQDADQRVKNLIQRNNEMQGRVIDLNTKYVGPLRQSAKNLSVIAEETRTPNQQNTKCTDVRFADRLDGAARSLAGLSDIEPPDVKPAEGNASVMEAMNRLLVMVGLGGGNPPDTADKTDADFELGTADTPDKLDTVKNQVRSLEPTDRAALLVASLIDSGLLLFALLLPTDPLSGGFGGKHRPETVAERLRQYALARPEAFTDVLELRFSKGGRHFVAQPDGQWLKTDDSELPDDMKPQRIKLRSLKTIVDHLEHAKLLRTCIIPNRNWWPWRDLVERARMTVNDAGWIEKRDEHGQIDLRKSRLHIFHAHLADIDGLVSLDHPGMRVQSNSHSAMDVSGLPSQYAGVSRENSERINLILKIDEDIARARRTEGFRESHIQNQLNQIFMLRQYLERSGIHMVGGKGEVFDPQLHREAGAPVDSTDFPPNTIVEPIKPGFARVEQRGASRGRWIPIVQAAVIRSPEMVFMKPQPPAPDQSSATTPPPNGQGATAPVEPAEPKNSPAGASPIESGPASAPDMQDASSSPTRNGGSEPRFKTEGDHSLFDDDFLSDDDSNQT